VFDSIDHDRPTCFLAYTIKGWGTPIAGHKDNHGGLMTKAQMAEWQATWACPRRGVGAFATVAGPDALKAFLVAGAVLRERPAPLPPMHGCPCQPLDRTR
jgi:pyruvate dehydrogenase E1 component